MSQRIEQMPGQQPHMGAWTKRPLALRRLDRRRRNRAAKRARKVNR